MIAFENIKVMGFEQAIRGMRNPLNSWEKSDTLFFDYGTFDDELVCHDIRGEMHKIIPEDWNADIDANEIIGKNDLVLMKKLSAAGSDHAKFRRMITVYMDITAPLYWWKEFDTYKVGTVANSCSTMHTIANKEFTLEDFSVEHLITGEEPFDEESDVCFHDCNLDRGEICTINIDYEATPIFPIDILERAVIPMLNECRKVYLETKDKRCWWQMIQLLPSSYNQKRTVMMNYEVLANIYHSRKNHKLDEWVGFCKLITALPYAEGIIFPELTEDEKIAEAILFGDGSWDPVEGENGSD